MDIFVLKAVVDELQQQLPGATVTKVFQINRNDLLLRLWRGRELRLLLSTHASLQCLHLTTSRFDNPPRPPRFAAFLRAHLRQLRLRDISVQPYDRVVHVTWERPGEPDPALSLIHELAGRQANIILINREGVILDALKHVHPDAPPRRTILPGHPYQPLPLPPQRLSVFALTLEQLAQLHQQGMFDVPHLQRLLIGVSPVLVTELLHRCQGNPHLCWELLQQLRRHYEDKTLRLWLCTTPEGTRHLSVLPLTHCAATSEPFTSAQEAVAAFYELTIRAAQFESWRREMQKTLRQRQQKLHKKMANLRHDQQKLQSYLPYQHYGTLLVAQRLPRGTTSATVVDYYHPDQPTITIPLDPRLSVRDNAQRYFKKYRKAKSGLAKVQALLDQYAAEARHLEALMQQVTQAEAWPTLHAVAAALSHLPPSSRRRRCEESPPEAMPARPYRTFVSRDGYTLYCGKNNQGNELLLRQIAAPNDIWLHAHQQAGAHVVVKVQPQQEIPPQTLIEAAALAAFYSKGRHAAAVEVMYTRVKHVRKFRGARPGQVQVTQYRTLEVAPRLPTA
jgi:predicted ribosome quality control (RQC) complex YloA/Tae2 family protein